MFTVFPRTENRRVEDVTWIPKVAQWGWVILAKDGFRLPEERRMITRTGVRVFSLPNANMKAEAMIERFLVNEDRILRACGAGGPFHYSVGHERLRVMELLR